jgi:hypothetical protein
MTISGGTSGARTLLFHLGALFLMCTMAGCAAEGRAVTAQDECLRGGGAWRYTGCEYSAGGGSGSGSGM